MTIFGQILSGALVFVFVILGVVGANNYSKTKEFINDQLGANAHHTATSLSLVILNSLQDAKDKASAQVGEEGDEGDDLAQILEKQNALLAEQNALLAEQNAATTSDDGVASDETAVAEQSPVSAPPVASATASDDGVTAVAEQQNPYEKLLKQDEFRMFLENVISPVFDSGYYSKISFSDPDGKVIYEKTADELHDVNEWFAKLINIATPVVSQQVRAWQLIGSVQVQISPTFAYSQMYSLLKGLALSLVAVFAGSLLVIYFALKAVLAPLNRVRGQAEAILGNEFIVQDKLPRTKEIRKIVEVMNSMVSRVKMIFEKEANMLQRYNELLYTDEATKLKNRRYFVNKYKECLSSEERSSGHLLMLSVKESYHLKNCLGYARSVEFIRQIAMLLGQVENIEADEVFKISENEFVALIFKDALLVENIEELMAKLADLFKEFGLDASEFQVAGSLVGFEATPLNELLSAADNELMRASGNFKFTKSERSGFALGKEALKDFIVQAMVQDKFSFVAQGARALNGELLHEELYLRLVLENGEKKSAAFFMPFVQQLRLGDELDFYVIKKALELKSTKALAINVGAGMMRAKNAARLARLLDEYAGANVCFELSMNSQLRADELIAFSKFLRQRKIGLGFDHFELSSENLLMLNELNISYIKTPANMLNDLLSSDSAAGAANSIEIILKSKNVQIIATGVENAAEKEAASRLNITALQGRFIDEIKDFNG